MLVPWYFAVCIFVALGLMTGRLVAGPRSRHVCPALHYSCGNRFGFACAIVSGGLCFLATFGIGVGRVYVFDSELRLYYSFGSSQVALGNGLTGMAVENALANLSDTTMTLENVTYGDATPEESVTVLPHALVPMPSFNIHYLPNDIPQEKTDSRSGGASRWWLRRATAEEAAVASAKRRLQQAAEAARFREFVPTVQMPDVSDEAVERSWASFRQQDVSTSTASGQAPQHGFRFGQGKRREPTAQEILEMSASELAEYAKRFAPPISAPAPAPSSPFGSDPMLNQLDPYPTEISGEEREAIDRQVDQDMNRNLIRERTNQGLAF